MSQYRVLILAPRGRDADVASALIEQDGISCVSCPDVETLMAHLADGAALLLATEEALTGDGIDRLVDWLNGQEPWSDLPIVVLTNGARSPRSAAAMARLQALGNVVILDRPLHADALVKAVRSAWKARRRQYEVRDFARTLEASVADRTRDLEAARESLQIALDAAEMGGWDLDLITGEARRTARHDQIFGYDPPRRDWSRDIFLAHVAEEHRERATQQFDAAAGTGVLDLECLIDVGTAKKWIAAKGRVEYDPMGTPVRMTGVISDISARKEADAQLAQAQKMESIGQLTGGVAHDFNNLLTPIVYALDTLRKSETRDDRAQRLINMALQASERATTLTQRLLAFARRQTLQPRSVDVRELVEGMVDLLQRSLGPTVIVRLDIAADLPTALVDPNQLELALLNLAINARDAMPDGGTLTIGAAASDADVPPRERRCVELSVSDTGVGMDTETLGRATEPFFSTKPVGKGTGLGLSMVHGLAAQSGGRLEISSEEGEGTTIRLFLPVGDELTLAERVPVGSRPPSTRQASILLVDDEEIVRTATAGMLRDLGHKVRDVSSGSVALATIKAEPAFDVVVTDYLMPNMSGAALIKEMRSAGYAVPALLITGYANTGHDVPTDMPKLAKPFRQADIATKLAEILGPAGTAEQ